MDDDGFTADYVENCNLDRQGDGMCDDRNNNALCGTVSFTKTHPTVFVATAFVFKCWSHTQGGISCRS